MRPSLTEGQRRPVWLPPLASLVTLFSLFLTATAVRHSPVADASRPVMVVISTAAAVGIALYGAVMLVQSRARGLAAAGAGLVMVALGLMTTLHLLR